VVPTIKAKRLRALGVTAGARSSIFPEIPTIAESGVAGYDAAGWNALFLPRAAARDLVMRVYGTVKDSLSAPRLKEVLVNAGADAVGNTPDELARFFQTEITKWSKVVKEAGISGQ
jgi:tripartite-type tricarboxylate transporter receptor subunit TctC